VFRRELSQHFLPNDIVAGTLAASSLPLLESRAATAETTIYVCRNRACQLPVHSVRDALEQLALGEQ
jgi:uncharacterized protein YyaL (SSP411 family)